MWKLLRESCRVFNADWCFSITQRFHLWLVSGRVFDAEQMSYGSGHFAPGAIFQIIVFGPLPDPPLIKVVCRKAWKCLSEELMINLSRRAISELVP
jgi:hypothetical protein